MAKQDSDEFTVKTSGYDVTVKGTKFDVSAYDDDPVVSTSLMQGKVVISQGETRMEMKPGETVTLDKTTGSLMKTATSDTPNAWTMNSTDFNGYASATSPRSSRANTEWRYTSPRKRCAT